MGNMSNILHNATVDALLKRRSIRKFKPKPLSDDIVETLETVAQHAASSQFLNDWSAIRITDLAAKKRLAEIGGQPYIATAPLLYVFVLDEHRNAAIAASKGVEIASDEFTLKWPAIVTLRRRMTQFWRFMQWRRPLIRSALAV